jgi:hypothetical protein
MFSPIKPILSKLILPMAIAVVRSRARRAKHGNWQAGNCCFYGPPEFLAVCSKATKMLSVLDQPIYQSLLEKRLWFWFENELHKPAWGERGVGISPQWLAWNEQGVISCLIYEQFEVELIYSKPLWRQCLMNWTLISQQVYYRTHAWLKEHDFPCELVDCFRR